MIEHDEPVKWVGFDEADPLADLESVLETTSDEDAKRIREWLFRDSALPN